ncbi:hypothetical protein K420107F6_26800 [Lactonifactor longoviformis]
MYSILFRRGKIRLLKNWALIPSVSNLLSWRDFSNVRIIILEITGKVGYTESVNLFAKHEFFE